MWVAQCDVECVVLAVGGGGGTWLYQSVRFPGSLSGTPGYVNSAMQYLRERFETHLCIILFCKNFLLSVTSHSEDLFHHLFLLRNSEEISVTAV